MIKYVAFLRGINVGGHKPIKMEELKKVFDSMGFHKVKTLFASGNVLFETPETGTDNLIKKIEEKLKEKFGHEIGVLLRTKEEIRNLVVVSANILQCLSYLVLTNKTRSNFPFF